MDTMTVYNMTKEIDTLTIKNAALQAEVNNLNKSLKQTTGLLVGASIVALALGIFNMVELYLFEDRYGVDVTVE